METEFAVARTRSRHCQLAALLFSEFNRVVARRIRGSSHGDRHADILHQPDPLPYRLRPHLFVGPANLVGPVGGVVKTFRFNADRKRANHLARTHAVERRPVIALAVHHTGRERIPADEPLSLLLRQVFRFQIASQMGRRRERFRFRKQNAGVATKVKPDGESAQIVFAAKRNSVPHFLHISVAIGSPKRSPILGFGNEPRFALAIHSSRQNRIRLIDHSRCLEIVLRVQDYRGVPLHPLLVVGKSFA